MIEIIKNILKVFDKHHLWDKGVELIGSWCFLFYQRHLGAKAYPFRTQDIDFLIPTPYRGKDYIDLLGELEKLGFEHSFKPNGSVYLWNAELKIEFISPDKGRGTDRAIPIKQLGLSVIPLRFVNILLENPIFVEEDNIKILIPNPASFCLHKLLIAVRRRKPDKNIKDFEQSIHTFAIADKAKIRQIYSEFPRAWKLKVNRNLLTAKKTLPLLEEEIDRIIVTLQDIK